MSAIISRATVVGGHDGRAEIEVELTYDNGGTSTISLDEEACIASRDASSIVSIRCPASTKAAACTCADPT